MGSGFLDPGMTTTQLTCGDVMHILWVRVSANLNSSCKQWVSNTSITELQHLGLFQVLVEAAYCTCTNSLPSQFASA
jgi:hypothetical protein